MHQAPLNNVCDCQRKTAARSRRRANAGWIAHLAQKIYAKCAECGCDDCTKNGEYCNGTAAGCENRNCDGIEQRAPDVLEKVHLVETVTVFKQDHRQEVKKNCAGLLKSVSEQQLKGAAISSTEKAMGGRRGGVNLHVAQSAGVDGENIESNTDQKTENNRDERLRNSTEPGH